ncbi:galactokinase [Clostridium sp. KNHs205]|jgi:galactokinase|uniref:galactokinase n=1 Tax=Clostridium sp. KNHs205 TaxID=1449050 RepID=UPI00051BD1BF|nr:galactokinase [Clostridium sp. KNHs205]
MKKELLSSFQEVFGGSEPELFFAPGRVNLIGEHTDYNGGHVFPCALTIGTYGAARKNGEKVLRFYSLNFKELGVISVSLEGLTYDKKDDWANYPKGVIKTLQERGFVIDEGMDLLYFGNIPNASGLSSSASVEVLTGFIAKELFGLDISLIDIALVSQYAENNFIGVNCGIMDQFAIAMGKKDHAIFLDTSDLAYEYAPIKLENAKIVIACSNKKRGLGDSKYNERRQECEDALAALQTKLDIKSLGELTEEEFEKNKDLIGDPIRTQRAKHAVYENQRTVKAVKALEAGNISLFGELMNASHVSLRDDYEVTGIELDTLVEASWAQEGVIGARMTGAGFGGCTVSIVENAYVDAFIENVGKIYEDKIGYKADFYVVEVGDGPVRL